MREVVLAQVLASLAPEAAVDVLEDLVAAAREPRTLEGLVAVTALPGGLGRLPYEAAAAVYAAATATGRPRVAGLFLGSAGDGEPPQPERFVPAARRSLTLGERKALARGRRREILVALLADPDASVIRALLENPRLTEREVITVAARRPARADVLRVLAASRWCARYHVKRALVMNPYTPSEIAVRLVPALVEADRSLVAADPNLATTVRDAARGA
jgi:hypothetical protein